MEYELKSITFWKWGLKRKKIKRGGKWCIKERGNNEIVVSPNITPLTLFFGLMKTITYSCMFPLG